MIYTYTYFEKSEREQMCFINYTWLTVTNFFSTFTLYFYYPKHENTFKEGTDKPKQEKNVFSQNIL